MAAHIVTALKEIIAYGPKTNDEGESTAFHFGQALQYAMLGDLVDHKDWIRFFRHSPGNIYELSHNEVGDCIAKPLFAIQELAAELLPKYEKIWEDYGKPDTAEAWQVARNEAYLKRGQ